MSVDRLDLADVQVLCRVHDSEGSKRKPPKGFRGWYVFPAGLVRSLLWCVYPDPTLANPWHAEVCHASDDEDHFLQKCTGIASQAIWRARPMSEETVEFLAQASDSLS